MLNDIVLCLVHLKYTFCINKKSYQVTNLVRWNVFNLVDRDQTHQQCQCSYSTTATTDISCADSVHLYFVW